MGTGNAGGKGGKICGVNAREKENIDWKTFVPKRALRAGYFASRLPEYSKSAKAKTSSEQKSFVAGAATDPFSIHMLKRTVLMESRFKRCPLQAGSKAKPDQFRRHSIRLPSF